MKRWICCLFMVAQLAATEQKAGIQIENPKIEELSRATQHTVVIDGKQIPYEAIVGNLVVKNEKGQDVADFHYISYRRTDIKDSAARPITFCFNGGPGSSSVWLHMGALGPRRIATTDWGMPERPIQIKENPYSILDKTDLVFIDPVSTGFSRAFPGQDAKQFYGVNADIESVAHFIRLFTSKYQRWLSPKYLAGESYGTARAVGLAYHLQEVHHLQVDGLFLISCILNFQPYSFDKGNDLAYITFLPTYTAIAWYHKKLPAEKQKDLQNSLKESIAFAEGEYAQALLKGDKLDDKSRKRIADKLASLTGLSQEFIEQYNLRINIWTFAKNLLKNEGKVIGRFDGRQTGFDDNPNVPWTSYDPSIEEIFGPVTAAFNDYVCTELQCPRREEYTILASLAGQWDYDVKNKYFDIADDLKKLMVRNPRLRVFVGSGYQDLATPFNAADYTLKHLFLNPDLQSHIHHYQYQGGHMLYLNVNSLIQLRKDMVSMFGR